MSDVTGQLHVPTLGASIGESHSQWGIECTIELFGDNPIAPHRHLFEMHGRDTEADARAEIERLSNVKPRRGITPGRWSDFVLVHRVLPAWEVVEVVDGVKAVG